MKLALQLDDRALDALIDQLLPRLVARMPAPVAQAAPRYLGAGDVAKLIGLPSRKALEMRLHRSRARGEIHPLEKIALDVDGSRRWLESMVVAWVEAAR